MLFSEISACTINDVRKHFLAITFVGNRNNCILDAKKYGIIKIQSKIANKI